MIGHQRVIFPLWGQRTIWAENTIDHQPGRRRFGWYRSKPDGKLDSSIMAAALSEGDWADFRTLTTVVERLRPFHMDYLALAATHDDLARVPEELNQRLNAELRQRMLGIAAGVDAQAHAQRRANDFLGAASAFRDRAMTRLRKEFGAAGDEPKAFKNKTSEWFDATLAYRLLYQLRNHAQHQELPISYVPIKADRQIDGTMHAQVALHLLPATLVASSLINVNVRAELAAMPADPLDLVEMAAIYMRAHGAMMVLILDAFSARLKAMARYAGKIRKDLGVPDDCEPVIWDCDDPSQGLGAIRRAHFMRFDELERLVVLRDALAADPGP